MTPRTVRRLARLATRATSLVLALLLVMPASVLAAGPAAACAAGTGVDGMDVEACPMGAAGMDCPPASCCCAPSARDVAGIDVARGDVVRNDVGPRAGSPPASSAAPNGTTGVALPPRACGCEVVPAPASPVPGARASVEAAAAFSQALDREVAMPLTGPPACADGLPFESVRPPGRCAAHVLFCVFLI